MTLDDVSELLMQISLVDDRVMRTDPAEIAEQQTMWARALIDVPLDFAGEAVGAHYAEHHWPVKPSDITARWRAATRDRMDRHAETVAPAHDPDDVIGYRDALAGQRRAVVTGEQQPNPIRQLNAAPPAAERPYMPPGFREAVGLREHPPELSVPCPPRAEGGCGAAERQPCVSPMGRTRETVHAARQRALQHSAGGEPA